jgi:release factor glutamine methyltransferase
LMEVVELDKPLAYVLGYEIFYWQQFTVTKDTLIPRSETEQLVSLVISDLDSLGTSAARVLVDLGTGSWCIGVSLMTIWGWRFTDCFLTDISWSALTIAKRNAQHLLPDTTFYKVHTLESDLLDFFPVYWEVVTGKSLIVTANLPYIPDEYTWVEDDVAAYEPDLALYSWKDWLNHYRKLLTQLIHYADTFGCHFVVYCELITEQVPILSTYVAQFDWISAISFPTFHENISLVKISV